jgi:hypothetical protein
MSDVLSQEQVLAILREIPAGTQVCIAGVRDTGTPFEATGLLRPGEEGNEFVLYIGPERCKPFFTPGTWYTKIEVQHQLLPALAWQDDYGNFQASPPVASTASILAAAPAAPLAFPQHPGQAPLANTAAPMQQLDAVPEWTYERRAKPLGETHGFDVIELTGPDTNRFPIDHTRRTLFVREEYATIKERVDQVAASPQHDKHRALIIEGNPGVGKSCALNFLALQFVAERKAVLFIAAIGWRFDFLSHHLMGDYDFKWSELWKALLQSEPQLERPASIIVLYDIKSSNHFPFSQSRIDWRNVPGFAVFVFASSPDADNLKDVEKACVFDRFTLGPLRKELAEVVWSKFRNPRSPWSFEQLFYHTGGISRSIAHLAWLDNPEEEVKKLNAAIDNVKIPSNEVCAMPPTKSTSKLICVFARDGCVSHYGFTSAFAADCWLNRLEKSEEEHCLRVYRQLKVYRSEVDTMGRIFEKCVLMRLETGECPLLQKTKKSRTVVKTPNIWQEIEKHKSMEGVIIIPTNPNERIVDFVIVQVSSLILIQCTLGMSHGPNASTFRNFLNAAAKVKCGNLLRSARIVWAVDAKINPHFSPTQHLKSVAETDGDVVAAFNKISQQVELFDF